MAVTQVQSGSGSLATTTGTSAGGASQFLQLLVTQIQNQDPFNPMDNAEFTAQLAQLASLEQLQAINGQLGDNLTVSQSLNNTMLLSLVGRRATVPGQDFSLAGGTADPFKVQAATGGTATVTVKDAAGQVVATYQRPVTAGWNDLTWDGRLADGSVAPDGAYTFSVEAKDRAGNAIATTGYVTGEVESIRFEDGVAIVSIAGHDYYVSEIAQVSR